jgi:thymidylate synthase
MFCHLTGYFPGKLIYTIGDSHIYLNHVNQVKEQLLRPIRPFPKLKIIKENIKTIDDFDMSVKKMGYPQNNEDILIDEFKAYYYSEKSNFFGKF